MSCKVALVFGFMLTAAACEAPRGPDVTKTGKGPANPRDAEPYPYAVDYPIVFSSDRTAGVYDIHMTALDGARTRRVTQGGEFWVPRWSPDGETILFRRQDGVSAEVGLISPGDKGFVLLSERADARQFLFAVNWSPDGSEVAYAARADPEDLTSSRLWKVSRTGGAPTRVFPDVEVPQRELVWSLPDGSRLAHTEGDPLELWLSDTAAGDRGTNISAGQVDSPVELAWSPDGRRIAMTAYALDADGNVEGLSDHVDGGTTVPDGEIFVVDVETHEFTRVTDNAAQDYAPAWSPDGTSLLVTSDRDGDLDLWLVPLDAPDDARNLIDDNRARRSDGLGHWFLGLP